MFRLSPTSRQGTRMDQMKLDLRLQLNCEVCDQPITSEESYQLRWQAEAFGVKEVCSGCGLPVGRRDSFPSEGND